MKLTIKTIAILAFFSVLFAACGGAETTDNNANTSNANSTENTANNNNVSANEVSAPDIESPTAENTLVRTPMPTARPLLTDNETSQPGAYYSSSAGISAVYPAGWDILFEDEGPNLLGASNPAEWMYFLLQAYPAGEDETLEDVGQDMLDSWFDQITPDTENSREIDDSYALADGTPAWRGRLFAGVDGQPGEIVIDVVLAKHGSRVVIISVLAWDRSLENSAEIVTTFRDGVGIFESRPYGVDRDNALFLAGSEPDSFDPALWKASAAGIVGDLFSGLVRLDTNLQPIPDLAERWEVSADGLTYTFYLRKGVTFHSGRAFTAEDVRFSWERALDPDLKSVTVATYMGDIAGAKEILAGETDTLSGIEIVDDYTLRVTLDAPKAYFLYKLAYPTSWIVDKETIDTVAEKPNGTGPFRMVQHDEDQLIILERNPFYHERAVSLEYIVYILYPGSTVRSYESGEIDLTGINEDLLTRAEDPTDPLHGTVLPSNNLCTTYALFDSAQAPFDDLSVRKAFAMVLDKAFFNENIMDGKSVIAEGLYPPGLPGYTPDVTGLPFDVPAAQALLASSSYAGNMPEIVYTTQGTGGDLSAFDATLIQAWQDSLGVEITVEQLDHERAYEEIISGNHGQILTSGWCADYPDPENFADVLFHTGSEQNLADYSNPEIDALLEIARSESDITERIRMYQEIEQMLIDDAAGVFLFHSAASYAVSKTYIDDYLNTPIGVAQHMNVTISH